ncbi:hypothetical protein LU298_13460 [Komagataeibacter intermedius]|uniref:hypothetical protein n=1 Tax=Komagataeibacter intermedius TaxID=66229 RepID=UPI001F22FD84|nr:hypothetical protein [Komagataeibacter intermedius]MCF3637497.1 hypothetical protein [Komagataeibacter intermedius]
MKKGASRHGTPPFSRYDSCRLLLLTVVIMFAVFAMLTVTMLTVFVIAVLTVAVFTIFIVVLAMVLAVVFAMTVLVVAVVVVSMSNNRERQTKNGCQDQGLYSYYIVSLVLTGF